MRGAGLMQKRCKATKRDGSPCNGAPFKGGDYCWFHDPAEAEKRADGRRLGGSAKSNRARARKQLASAAMTPAELEGVIGLTITQVLAGTKAPGIGQAVAALARAAITIRETTEIEQRLEALESANGVNYGQRRA
jgi:hypothetical protein